LARRTAEWSRSHLPSAIRSESSALSRSARRTSRTR
jgi:hypothetical protein